MDSSGKVSIIVFPIAIISLSVYAMRDLSSRWDRFLLVSAHLCKLEGILGLHEKITDKLTLFKDDEYLFKDYRENIKYANSDIFRKQGKKWKWTKLNTYISIRWVYFITIGIGVGLSVMDYFLLKGA